MYTTNLKRDLTTLLKSSLKLTRKKQTCCNCFKRKYESRIKKTIQKLLDINF